MCASEEQHNAENVRTEALLKADDPPPAPAWFSGDAAYGWACGWSAGFLAALALIDGGEG